MSLSGGLKGTPQIDDSSWEHHRVSKGSRSYELG